MDSHTGKPKVAFICVHNACRSQIAEALGRQYAAEVFESFSAGTHPQAQINPDAVRLMKQHYGIDMEKRQYSKTLDQIPQPDVVILMGCNVSCPQLACRHVENWELEDPTGQSDAVFTQTMALILEKIQDLKHRLA